MIEKYFCEEEERIEDYTYSYPSGLELIEIFKDCLPVIIEDKLKHKEDTNKFLKLKSLVAPDGKSKTDNWLKKFERAKQTPIIDLYKFEGLRKTGRDYSASCPFHQERTSGGFKIFADGGFKCFSCGTFGGDSIDFIRQLYAMDTTQAVNHLTKGGSLERHSQVLSKA